MCVSVTGTEGAEMTMKPEGEYLGHATTRYCVCHVLARIKIIACIENIYIDHKDPSLDKVMSTKTIYIIHHTGYAEPAVKI